MGRSGFRVSKPQWSTLLDFLERNPNLVRTHTFNCGTARSRTEISRQWSELAKLLNAEGSGSIKTPQGWSAYIRKYKSKLKMSVLGTKTNANRTGRRPLSGGSLSETESRFISIMGHNVGQNAPAEAVNLLPDMDQPSTAAVIQQQTPGLGVGQGQNVVMILTEGMVNTESGSSFGVEPRTETTAASSPSQTLESASSTPTPADAAIVPRRPRQRRYRNRPLAPLDEARRVSSRVELQRAAADRANARANQLIAQNLGRLADAVERYLSHMSVP